MHIIATIRAFFGLVPSTEKALAGFTKAIADLEAVVAHENSVIDNHAAQIDALQAKVADTAKSRLDAFKRRDRAATLVHRVNAFVA